MADQKITDLTAVVTPVDTDVLETVQGVGTSPVNKKITWTVIKAFLKSYFDTLYPLISNAVSMGFGKGNSASIRLEVKTDGTFTQGVRVEGDVVTRLGFSAFISGDNFVRYTQGLDGKMEWGLGSVVADTNLYRSAINTLKTDGNFIVGKALNESKGTDIASSSSIDIGAGIGNMIDITGTTTITALGTVQAGTRRILRFTGILTLTHNATSLILPTGANIVTQAGDIATMISLGSGNWVCASYQRKDGSALLSGSSASPLSISTIFENLSRLDLGNSNFTQTITATGLYQQANVTSGQQWAVAKINGYKSKSFLGNPTIASCFYLSSSASQTGKEIYFGTGKIANGVGHTFTDRHIGFKMIQVGGGMQIRGTQSDGTTEVTTAILGTLYNDEKVYMKAIVNSVSGSVYYEVRIGTTTNSASLTTNFPTNVDASDEALLQFSMNTRNAWDGFYGYWVSANYIRQ